jgi:hypothetical protein
VEPGAVWQRVIVVARVARSDDLLLPVDAEIADLPRPARRALGREDFIPSLPNVFFSAP